MRRADRLFQIIQVLRRTRKPMTADAIAAELADAEELAAPDFEEDEDPQPAMTPTASREVMASAATRRRRM